MLLFETLRLDRIQLSLTVAHQVADILPKTNHVSHSPFFFVSDVHIQKFELQDFIFEHVLTILERLVHDHHILGQTLLHFRQVIQLVRLC